MTRYIFLLFVLFLQALPATVFAQGLPPDRLPNLVRTNAFLAGQVLGCIVRYEVYASETLIKLQNAGAPVPPQMADLNAFFGVELGALRHDVVAALHAITQGATVMETQIAAIREIGLAELNATDFSPGVYPAWMQVAGCTTLLRQLGLSEAYPS